MTCWTLWILTSWKRGHCWQLLTASLFFFYHIESPLFSHLSTNTNYPTPHIISWTFLIFPAHSHHINTLIFAFENLLPIKTTISISNSPIDSHTRPHNPTPSSQINYTICQFLHMRYNATIQQKPCFDHLPRTFSPLVSYPNPPHPPICTSITIKSFSLVTQSHKGNDKGDLAQVHFKIDLPPQSPTTPNLSTSPPRTSNNSHMILFPASACGVTT